MSKHHAPLSSSKWEVVRRRTFNRDGFRCQACGRPGRLECDHVQPLERGGALWDLGNLQSLCRSCHLRKTEDENTTGGPIDGQDQWRHWVRSMLV